MFRNERCKGSSEISGQYVVEDVSVDGEWFRRLIFLHNSSVLQSEAKLKSGTENFDKFVICIVSVFLLCLIFQISRLYTKQ